MGPSSSHLNSYALSQIICLTTTDLFRLLTRYTQKYPSRSDTRITRDELRALLLEFQAHPSDIDIMCNVLTSSDVYGRGYGLMTRILVAILVLMPLEIHDKVRTAIDIMYGQETMFISKKDLSELLKALNAALGYYGDKNVYPDQVDDLIDSVFTICGKVDGEISRYDAIGAVSGHPIVEMVISLQFQGSIIQKKELLAAELGEQL